MLLSVWLKKGFHPQWKPQRCKVLRSRNSARDHGLIKPSKQTSQCLSTGENCPRSNFCFVWSWPKNRFPSHSALPPSLLTSLPSSLPLLEFVETAPAHSYQLVSTTRKACPQLSVIITQKGSGGQLAWKLYVSPGKILLHLSPLYNTSGRNDLNFSEKIRMIKV